ncbi:MAG: ROK family glucokinase [Clostridiales bacterium]|nr:ROK family glucokinase [Clostridiales bacterium]
MGMFFGVDIGGTEIKFGAFSEAGDLLEKWSAPTDISDMGRKIIPDVARHIRQYTVGKGVREDGVAGIGMGIPGPVDKAGYVRTCVNLRWNGFNPVEELKKEFPDVKIAAGNDANTAALGEYYRGAGKNYDSMMLITLGTGVGGGIIMNGKVLLGAHGLAGEIGHVSAAVPEKEQCSCGNTGCIDQFASATGIVRIMKRLLKERKQDSILRKQEMISAKDVCEAACQGDALAVRCIDICMGALGNGLAYFSHAFDPEVYVIGGGVSGAGEIIISAFKKAYREKMFLIRDGAEICLSKLGNDAGMVGACMLVMNGG